MPLVARTPGYDVRPDRPWPGAPASAFGGSSCCAAALRAVCDFSAMKSTVLAFLWHHAAASLFASRFAF